MRSVELVCTACIHQTVICHSFKQTPRPSSLDGQLAEIPHEHAQALPPWDRVRKIKQSSSLILPCIETIAHPDQICWVDILNVRFLAYPKHALVGDSDGTAHGKSHYELHWRQL